MTSISTQRKLRSLLPILAAGVFMVVGVLVLVFIGRDKSKILNSPMPDLELVSLLVENEPSIGTPWTRDALQGKVTVFHFWGTWCGPCRGEYPEFDALMQELQKEKDLQVVSVSCSGGPESDLDALAKETEEFVKPIGSRLPVYADPAAYTRGRLAAMFSSGGFRYPMTLVVDRGGAIRHVYRGPANPKKLQKDIVAVLSSPTASTGF